MDTVFCFILMMPPGDRSHFVFLFVSHGSSKAFGTVLKVIGRKHKNFYFFSTVDSLTRGHSMTYEIAAYGLYDQKMILCNVDGLPKYAVHATCNDV